MNIIDSLDLNKAFRRIDSDKRDDAWTDVVGFRDYKKKLPDYLDKLKARLATPKTYAILPPSVIDLPKRGFTLRPGVVPQLEDRIAYQAIADLLAPHFTPEVNVFSNKLADVASPNMFVPGVTLWLSFLDQVEYNCTKFPFVVETDITAYFDHISHEVLLSRISDLFGSKVDTKSLDEIKILLKRLLKRWSENVHSFSIPQINDASSFFGNVYLDELDKWFSARGLVTLRYVDDIRLFANSEHHARQILSDLIVKLRKLGLFIASGKTKIRKSSDVLAELILGRKQMLEIEKHIKLADPTSLETALSLLKSFFGQLVATPDGFNDRQFRYCINRFKRLHMAEIDQDTHNQVIKEIVKRFATMPESTDVFVDYLSLFPNDEEVQQAVLGFLHGSYNIYPWQESLLMELLLRCDLSSKLKSQTNTFATQLIAHQKHPACKIKAYMLRGKNGTYADRKDIRSLYDSEDREDVKRSIVVAIQEMGVGERNNWFKSITYDSDGIARTVEYIRELNNPTYFYYNPPDAFHMNIEEADPGDSDDLNELGSEYFV